MASAPATTANQADFMFKAGDLTNEDLKVVSITGREEISSLYSFRLELRSDDAEVDFTTLVGKACQIEIRATSGTRYINGIVRRFERLGEGSKQTYYAAELVPLHWLLTKRVKSRIFLETNCEDMTVTGIIKKVLTDAGIPEEKFRFATQGTYVARESVVQYRESDWDFISRLMEDEGIFYFFEHDTDKHVLVFGDAPSAHVATPNAATVPFRDPLGLVPDQKKEHVFNVRDRQEIQIGAVSLDDFNFETPQVDVAADQAGSEFTSLEFYDYPGGYAEKDIGTAWARARLEEFQTGRRVQQMSATVRVFLPGFKFTLEEHPIESLNTEYLILGITHHVRQPQSTEEEAGAQRGLEYTAEVDTVLATVPFRPARKTPKPRIHGSQTAIVTGPSGEEIYVDKYGRVKVHFHWDREGAFDENSSFWIRVRQSLAGGLYGIIFTPRIGQEVVVEFLEGDPDRPLITGSVYNADNMPPYTLPDEKTKSTIKTNSSVGGGGFNELRFEDKKDSEQIFMHGQKDLHIRIKNDEFDFIGRHKHETIKSNQAKSIGGAEGRSVGGDQGIRVEGAHTLSVKGEMKHYSESNIAVSAEGDLYAVGVNVSLVADSSIEIAGATIVISGDSGVTIKCGGNFVTVDSSGVSIQGSAVNINSGGSALSPTSAAIAGIINPIGPTEPVTGDPGQDVAYEQEGKPFDPLEDAPVHDEDESTEEQTHWIGVRLYDDNGEPLAGERYLITLPDGTKVAKGKTNKNGEVEVRGIDPGSCTITFPDLDGATWEAGPAAGGTGGDSSTAAAPSGGGTPSVPSI
ncbi:MAG: type VI secretion system tip protein VgrG [Phycisphaerales bacterium]|nr:type VI secretion system tip protein VgrG [Phycisphaerales bacterium]